ncbi:hypothetical protein ABLE68_06680 [Nocardioides sp. CN2-186]|uniref:hypothetical protein n=1 Tax=Nocardioides tweenelious TaxID=3156607 RepID=UPI0032B544F2
MFYRPTRTVRLTLTAAKAAVVAAIVAVGLLSSTGGSTPVGQQSRYVVDQPTAVERLVARHHCSPSGFGSSAQPRSAIVRSAGGTLRYVDFETGWEVYTRHGAATLVAVCLDDPPARG